ncbi:OmpA family protein, partial [Stenotrophomonas maltophilia]|nr:OmpA family protein [Stenotrophomonas maltophilia]
ARKTLLGTLDATSARRIVVAGYGDSRPLAEVPPSDPRNRRVEVFFTLDGGRS